LIQRLQYLVIGIIVTACASSARASTYTLDQLLAKVRAANPVVAAGQYGVEAAQAQLRQAQLSWTPFGELGIRLSPTPTVRNERLPYDDSLLASDGRGVAALSSSYVDWLHPAAGSAQPFQGAQYSFYMSIIQPLYTFGKIESATEAAKAGVAAANEYARATTQDIEADASRAYWLVKCQRGARDLIDDITVGLEKWVQAYQKEMESTNQAGYSEGDLARLKAGLENARVTRFDIDRQLVSALAWLRAVAQDPEGDVDSQPIALDEADPRPIEWFEEAALVHRPEAQLAQVGTQAVRYLRRWRMADMLPSLVFGNLVGYVTTTNMDNPVFPSTVATNAPYPVPSPGPFQLHFDLDLAVRYGRLQQAEAAERAMRETTHTAVGLIRIDVRRAYGDYMEAHARAVQLAHAEKVSHGWYAIVKSNMASGITVANDARELIDAMREYFNFRLRHLQAIMDTKLDLAALRRATGAQ
jgi:outer membrane protein TolC